MVKAVIAGANGGIGQPLSLLFKTSPLISELALYDVVGTPGVAADLSHISTSVKVTPYLGPGLLPPNDPQWELAGTPEACFTGADIVVIPAGRPRGPRMTRDDLFLINADIVKGIVNLIADYAPNAFILVISNPVNSMVPVAAQALKAKKVFNAQRLFGVTTLDVVRAKTFVAELAGISPEELTIPVIGGHSAQTIVPILSQTKPAVKIPMEYTKHPFGHAKTAADGKLTSVGYKNVIERIQFGGDEVVGAKAGMGSATLSMAYAGFSFAEKVLKAAKGDKGITECTYVYLPGVPGGDAIAKATGCDFFSTPVELGTNGAEKAINILDNLNDQEKELLKHCLEGYTDEDNVEQAEDDITKVKTWERKTTVLAPLKANIAKGVYFQKAEEK